MIQRDRNYILRVGNKQILEISDLHITFQVRKSSDNKGKGNHASVSIYNLSDDNRKLLEEPKTQVALEVGYLETGLHLLFSGEATNVETTRQGADIVTTLSLDTLYTGLNHKLISQLAPPGATVEEAIRGLSKNMPEIAQTKFSGPGVKKKIVDGYPMSGTPRQILTEICSAFGLEWQIDDNILTVTDVEYSFMSDKEAFVIGEESGLIERPEVTEVERQRSNKDKKKKGRKGLQISMLLNPVLKAGGLIKLEFGELTGFYKIIDIQHEGEIFGGNWTTTITVASKV